MRAAQLFCTQLASAYAVHALRASEVAAAETHFALCPDCRRELAGLRAVIERFVAWPTDLLRPSLSLQRRLAARIAAEVGAQALPDTPQWSEPQWEDVAPGIECKLLACVSERRRVSMLVRLAPGMGYPPHTHAGVEELYLLDGELRIDERKLFPGNRNTGAPGLRDQRMWSEAGCTCLLITSTDDLFT